MDLGTFAGWLARTAGYRLGYRPPAPAARRRGRTVFIVAASVGSIAVVVLLAPLAGGAASLGGHANQRVWEEPGWARHPPRLRRLAPGLLVSDRDRDPIDRRCGSRVRRCQWAWPQLQRRLHLRMGGGGASRGVERCREPEASGPPRPRPSPGRPGRVCAIALRLSRMRSQPRSCAPVGGRSLWRNGPEDREEAPDATPPVAGHRHR
jgi:hypothetical protein